MTIVWERTDLNATQKLVLLALADWANDEGLCWPSIGRLAAKSSLTTRSVQKSIRSLEEIGFIKREEVVGKGNRYWISLPVNDVHPCPTFTPPLNDVHPTPEPRSPNTSITHQLNINEDMSSDDDAPVTEQEIIDYWNTLAEKHDLRKIRTLNESRRKQLRARIEEFPDLETWSEAFRNIETSSFLLGENDRLWTVNFDFLIRQSSFIRLIEGTYNV